MDISRWGLDQIMMLPDSCFGRRWPIGMTVLGKVTTPQFDIAEMALPERCVIWEFTALLQMATTGEATFEIRLGDQLPVTWAEFQERDLLFGGVRQQDIPGGLIRMTSMTSVNWQNMKMPVESAGRRFIIGMDAGMAVDNPLQVVLTVSSIPREVPDCLLSV